MSIRWPIDQKPNNPMPYLPATIWSWRSRGDSPRLREWPMLVAIARSAAAAAAGDPRPRRAPPRAPSIRPPPCPRIQRVLHQFGDRLARIALAARQPANKVERIGRPELEA